MRIVHYKKSRIAWAPDELSKCLNKYSNVESFVTSDPKDFEKADIVHFHNKYVKTNKKQLIQYHSEPKVIDGSMDYKHKKLVIAQYHATLPEYKDCQIVRNIIDFENEFYMPKSLEKIKIGYSPSHVDKRTFWADKGYIETVKILHKMKHFFNVDYDVITGVSLKECIKRKSECNIIIDECMTGSYHRSGLEGLALGKMTICSLNDDVKRILKKFSKVALPFENVWIDGLEQFLTTAIKNGTEYLKSIGNLNRTWMESYWHPQAIVNEYIKIYRSL